LTKSAKMAQRIDKRRVITVQAESVKKPLKKPNLLTIKMLSWPHRSIWPTGTPFATENLSGRKFVFYDNERK
ncbi:MAG: hypothetical protein ACE5NM_11845, partial [Sedimentisphaerales bacterium]